MLLFTHDSFLCNFVNKSLAFRSWKMQFWYVVYIYIERPLFNETIRPNISNTSGTEPSHAEKIFSKKCIRRFLFWRRTKSMATQLVNFKGNFINRFLVLFTQIFMESVKIVTLEFSSHKPICFSRCADNSTTKCSFGSFCTS